MSWSIDEAIAYYKAQGAPGDQTALVNLLREVQRENSGGIPAWTIPAIAQACGVKETFLLALIRRIPSLRLADTHCLELCGGPNCGRLAALSSLAEGITNPKITVKTVPCMRMCGKGPNIRWDGKAYHGADEALLRRLLEEAEKQG